MPVKNKILLSILLIISALIAYAIDEVTQRQDLHIHLAITLLLLLLGLWSMSPVRREEESRDKRDTHQG